MNAPRNFSEFVEEAELKKEWPKVQLPIRGFSVLAKWFEARFREEDRDNAYIRKHDRQLHAMLCFYVNFWIAQDRNRLLCAGSRKCHDHYKRMCDILADPCVAQAKVPIAMVLDKLSANEELHDADFELALESISSLPYDTKKVRRDLLNGLRYSKCQRRGAARHHCQMALAALKKIGRSGSNATKVAELLECVCRCLNEFRNAAKARLVPLPVCKRLFVSIENLEWMSTTRICPSLKRVQKATKLARLYGKFDEAQRVLDRIEADLLGPLNGGFFGPEQNGPSSPTGPKRGPSPRPLNMAVKPIIPLGLVPKLRDSLIIR